jgi:hypothetical protein
MRINITLSTVIIFIAFSTEMSALTFTTINNGNWSNSSSVCQLTELPHATVPPLPT